MTEWHPINTAPTDRPYLIAVYAPTSWAFSCGYVDLRAWKDRPDVLKKMIRMRHKWARYWCEAPDEPERIINDYEGIN